MEFVVYYKEENVYFSQRFDGLCDEMEDAEIMDFETAIGEIQSFMTDGEKLTDFHIIPVKL